VFNRNRAVGLNRRRPGFLRGPKMRPRFQATMGANKTEQVVTTVNTTSNGVFRANDATNMPDP
jgi:hypothetical protein